MTNTKPKQIIVVRKDLNMRKGKIAAQAAHASIGAVLSQATHINNTLHIDLANSSALGEWLFNGSFTKICVYVTSEQQLMDVYEAAVEKKLICCLIEDSGRTEFNNVKTKTCCAIGPCYPDELMGITDNLPLY